MTNEMNMHSRPNEVAPKQKASRWKVFAGVAVVVLVIAVATVVAALAMRGSDDPAAQAAGGLSTDGVFLVGRDLERGSFTATARRDDASYQLCNDTACEHTLTLNLFVTKGDTSPSVQITSEVISVKLDGVTLTRE